MGLSNFDRAAERVLVVVVMSTVLSVALFENMLRYVICASSDGCNWEFKFRGGPRWVSAGECQRTEDIKFGAEEEVSELSCKHFFHKWCLEKWFNNKNSTCPLCRSIH
ncbi:hypothetical protein SLE2022_203650 [Rubroshorea leprosula]